MALINCKLHQAANRGHKVEDFNFPKMHILINYSFLWLIVLSPAAWLNNRPRKLIYFYEKIALTAFADIWKGTYLVGTTTYIVNQTLQIWSILSDRPNEIDA